MKLTRIIIRIISVALMVNLCGAVAGNPSDLSADSAAAISIAIMPLANYTDRPEAIDTVMPIIETRLKQEDFRIINAAELRETLRKYRIRALGAIDVDDLARVAREVDIRYLMMGSVDFYNDAAVPEAGFSVRIIDVTEMKIIWAASIAAGGDDFTGWFGIGRITSMPELIRKLTDDAIESLSRTINQISSGKSAPALTEIMALVPFDNYSDAPYGSEIVASYILTDLIARGMAVVEPVLVANLFLEEANTPRGKIDMPLLETLHSQLGVTSVITGSVYRFNAAQGGVETSNPEIELTGRLLDAGNGRILAVYNEDRDGARSATLITRNSFRALGNLTRKVVHDMINSLEKNRARKDAKTRQDS